VSDGAGRGPAPADRPHHEIWDEVQAWLAEHWDPDLTVDAWWRTVAAAGWTAPHFEVERWGRGLSRRAQTVVRAAFADHGALRPPGGLGLLMAAPTILVHGTPEQVDRLVPPILEGRVAWCQLFSEPGAGSDLAGLTTRARRDGDRWVVTGQKVWSSMARDADLGMLLARTSFDVPKHKGISWFAFRLDQPGVTIRPLREMTGRAVFNEVFLDEAVCDAGDLIGGEGNGWAVTQTTLHFERTGIGAGGAHAGFPDPGPKGGMLGRRAGDAARDEPPDSRLIVGFPDVVDLARKQGRTADPAVRQDLARLYAYTETGRWNAQRGKAEAQRGGGQAVASIGKLAQTRIVKLAARLGTGILGPDGLLAGPQAVEGGAFAEALAFSAASSIYGGTDEIQRNIVAERSLGLPREPSPDRDRPYGEVLRDRRQPAAGAPGPGGGAGPTAGPSAGPTGGPTS
jgi:alkylation response protein AidB-like acyl-CoA dehydrogenase